jgi:hypothetical protein
VNDCAAPRHDEPEPAAPHSWLCRPCTSGLRRDLHRLPVLHAALGDLLDPRGAGGGGGSGDGLPYHEPASECRSQIEHDTEFWVMWIIGERQPSAWPARTMTAMCGWLSGWADWVPLWPWAGDMAAVFAADRGRAMSLLDPRPVADIPVDNCPRCEHGMLRAFIPRTEGDRRPTVITCTDCGHEWDTTQWLGLGRTILARKAAA